MGIITGILLLFLSLTVFVGAAESEYDEGLSYMLLPFERGSREAPAISVFYDLDYSGVGKEQPRTVIACIWLDGRAVWSADRTYGGPPYFAARLGPEQVRKLIAIFDARGFFTRKVWFDRTLHVPHHDINIFNGSQRVALTSCDSYVTEIKTPFLITKTMDAMACFRQQLELVLPREGQRLDTFDYEIRRLR